MGTNLNYAADLLLPNGRKVLQCEPMLSERIYELGDTYPGLHRDGLLLDIDVEHLVHERKVDHAGPGEREAIGGQPGAEGPEPASLPVGGGEGILERRDRVGLEEDAGVDLVSAAPVGDGVEVVGEGRVLEGDGLLVERVGREGEGVVGGGAAAEDEERVAGVLAEVGVGGRERGGGESTDELEVVVRLGGGGGAAEETGEEEVPHRGEREWMRGGGRVAAGGMATGAATAPDRDGF